MNCQNNSACATLKKNVVSGPAPGEDITAEWEAFFFFFFPKKRFFFKKFQSFLKKWGKKKNYGRPTGHNFGHPLDRKQTFFKGGLALKVMQLNK